MPYHPFIKYSLLAALISGLGDCTPIIGPFFMSHFNFSQFEGLLVLGKCMVIGACCMPLMPALKDKCGYRTVLLISFWLPKTLDFVKFTPAFLCSFCSTPVPTLCLYMCCPLSGGGTLQDALRVRLIREDEMAKFQAMKQPGLDIVPDRST